MLEICLLPVIAIVACMAMTPVLIWLAEKAAKIILFFFKES